MKKTILQKLTAEEKAKMIAAMRAAIAKAKK